MALKEKGEFVTSNIVYIDLVSTTGPTEEQPFFCTKRKEEKGGKTIMVVDKIYEEISGKVIEVVKNETSYKGTPVRAFKIKLEDEGEIIIISPTLTNSSKNMVNACLGSIGKEITLKPYLNKAGYPDVSCKSGSDFAKTAVKYNDVKLFDKIWNLASEGFKPVEVKNVSKIDIEDIPF